MADFQNKKFIKISSGTEAETVSAVASEESLSLIINGEPFAVMMRTPGYEEELVLGFLYSDGIIKDLSEVKEIGFSPDNPNEIRMQLPAQSFERIRDHQRATEIRSSCGICGSRSLEDLISNLKTIPQDIKVSRGLLSSLPDKMKEAQTLFRKTGGVHGVATFDFSGNLILCREDIGRHNALDKLIGHGMKTGTTFHDKILLLSSRSSYEMVAKAARAGFPIVAAISAPTTLAVDLADTLGITLIGFLRGEEFNIYTHPQRISL